MVIARGQQLVGFILIARSHDDHIGDASQVGEIIATGMSRSIFSNQASAIDSKQHIQILQCDIVNELIIGAL
jgi:hypothetical protein